jgi:hypothetical protein
MARKIKVTVTTATQRLEVLDYDSTTGEINNQYQGGYGGFQYNKENGLNDLTNAAHLMSLQFPDGGETGFFTVAEIQSLTIDGVVTATATLAAFLTSVNGYMFIQNTELTGVDDGGNARPFAVTSEGHLEVAVHSPRLPFGSIHTENLTPILQADGVYGINSQLQRTTTSGTGGATTENSSFKVSTGAGAGSFGTIQSRKRLRYRAGQGVVGRFTGLFSTPAASTIVVAGFGHAEDGVYFGYNGTSFGILYSRRGVREVRTLTVTVGATVAGSVIITLNDTAYTIAVTNSANIQRTVYEISVGTYAGWEAYAAGATVVFVRNSVGTTAGAYSFNANGTGSSASIVQTKAGAAATETWYPQTQWNGDRLDGSGDPSTNPSGVLLNKQTGNVFQIGIQYLGFGAITFQIEVTPAGNNPDFVTVHTLRLPNTLTDTSFGNPSYPFTMAAYSTGGTTDVSVKVGSYSGFIEGQKVLHGPRISYTNTITTTGSTNLQVLFSVRNTLYYGSRSNQSVINLLSVSGACKHNNPVVFYLIRNGVLAGNPNFLIPSSSSSSVWDKVATTVTYSTEDQVIATFPLGETGNFDHHFGNGEYNAEEVTLQPGDLITLAVRSVTGNPTYVIGTINTREDQ